MQRGTMRVRLLVASRERALPSERLYCLTFKNVQNVCKTRDAHRNLSWVGRFSFLLDGNPENDLKIVVNQLTNLQKQARKRPTCTPLYPPLCKTLKKGWGRREEEELVLSFWRGVATWAGHSVFKDHRERTISTQ